MSDNDAVKAPSSNSGETSTTTGPAKPADRTTSTAEPQDPSPAGNGPTADGARHASARPTRPARRPAHPTSPVNRLARHSPFAIGFFGALGALLAYQLATMLSGARSVLILVVVSMYLAVGLNPVVEWFVRRNVKRGLAVAAVFVGVVIVFGLIGLAIVPVVTEQVRALIEQVPTWFEQLSQDENLRRLDEEYEITRRVQDYITSGGLAERLFGGVVGASMIVLTLYFLGSLPAAKGMLYRFVPRSRRERVAQLGDEMLDRVGSYVGGQISVAAIAAVAAFIFFMVAGLREYALALAVVVAILGLIPLIGGTISAIFATVIGLLIDWRIGLACLIYFIVYQQIENYVIYPRIMQRSVKVPGSVIVIAALVGGSLFGIVGALLAVPTAAAILLLIREVIHPRLEEA